MLDEAFFYGSFAAACIYLSSELIEVLQMFMFFCASCFILLCFILLLNLFLFPLEFFSLVDFCFEDSLLLLLSFLGFSLSMDPFSFSFVFGKMLYIASVARTFL